MIKEPIRVLHIVSVMNHGGIENFLMNIYRNIDRESVQFDFLVTRQENGIFDDEIESLGGRIYKIPYIRNVGLKKYKKNVTEFFNKNDEYKIVHCHMNTWSGLFLSLAKKSKIPVRIAHSHSSQKGIFPKRVVEYGEYFFKQLMKSNIKNNATHFFSCSYDAGDWLYGKRIANNEMKIIKNGVDSLKLRYDSMKAKQARENLDISDNSLVIGHVGNMSPVKNHKFLIDIYKEVNKIIPDSFLCLVGDGEQRIKIEEYIRLVGLSKNVKILGIRNDVFNLLKAFDVFVMPSFFEGFPVSIIEAQAANLPCIISDNITEEVDMGLDLINFVSLQKSADYWAENIIRKNKINRNASIQKLIDRGFDIKTTAKELTYFYSEINNKYS